MKKPQGMLFGKFEFNSCGRLMQTLPELHCTQKRHHLKRNGFDYKQKLPVIIEVSFPESTEVPAHTGLTALDCRKRKRRHRKSQNCQAVRIFERFKP